MTHTSRRSNMKCPNLTFLQESHLVTGSSKLYLSRASEQSNPSLIVEIIARARKSMQEDEAVVIDPRMAYAGQVFLECGGVEALHMLVRRPKSIEHAEDARTFKKRLPRNGAPLARFISLHIADQPNQLGAAVRRRIQFGTRLLSDSSLAQDRHDLGLSRSTRPPKRVRASWMVSPLMFRLIMAFSHKFKISRSGVASETPLMVGGRRLGTGKDATRVYTFDDIVKEHPSMQGMCMHLYKSGSDPKPPRCYMSVDADQLYDKVIASMPDIPHPFVSEIALKDILDEDDAGTELQYHVRIHRWFIDKHSLHLTCLHPYLHFIQIDEHIPTKSENSSRQTILPANVAPPQKDGTYGRKLLVTRLMDGDTHRLNLREEELVDLSIAVLSALVIFHEHHYLHMDIKPDNILWSLNRHEKRVFCLGDYNLMLSEASVLLYLRPDDGGGFQSVSHGTPSYISPLLMVDDLQGSTYHKFQYVAIKTRSFGKNQVPIWRDYFEKCRVETTGAKIDLHSLALTLMKLAIPHGSSKQFATKLMGGVIGKFIAKLMFFRKQDFFTAASALAYLKEKRLVSSRVLYS